MSRLIDADKLNTEFAEILTALEGGMGKESITREEFAEAIKILKGCVDEQPTAYDVEKVVKQIQKRWCKNCRNIIPNAGYCMEHKCEIFDLCNIVKAGGVE